MSVERDIRFDLIARLCPNTTGAELRSVATEVCRRTSESLASSQCILCRRACLPYVRGARLLLNVTSLTPSRRLSDKARNSPARKCSPVPRNSAADVTCDTDHFTRCIIRLFTVLIVQHSNTYHTCCCIWPPDHLVPPGGPAIEFITIGPCLTYTMTLASYPIHSDTVCSNSPDPRDYPVFLCVT